MKVFRIFLAAAVVAALAIFAVSCKTEKQKSVTYAVTTFSFDNGVAADSASLRSELDSYLKGCNDESRSDVKSGAQKLVNKYLPSGKAFSYDIVITIYENGKSCGFINLSQKLG